MYRRQYEGDTKHNPDCAYRRPLISWISERSPPCLNHVSLIPLFLGTSPVGLAIVLRADTTMPFCISLSGTVQWAVSGRLAFALSLLLMLPSSGFGADPPVSGAKPTSPEKPADRNVNEQPPSDDTTVGELRDKREKAQAELNAVNRPGTLSTGAPPDVTQEELQERKSLLEQVVRGYDEQMNDYLRLEEARQRHADINRTSTEWTGFSEPRPYSIVLADQLWDTAYSCRLASDGLQSQLNLLSLRFDRARAALTSAQERLRQS